LVRKLFARNRNNFEFKERHMVGHKIKGNTDIIGREKEVLGSKNT
jgi:hypothetical protein